MKYIKDFLPNSSMSENNINIYLSFLKEKLSEIKKSKFCLSSCSKCPFRNYKGTRHCLPDFFYEKDDLYPGKGMYGRFYYSYEYYKRYYTTKFKQEEMDI